MTDLINRRTVLRACPALLAPPVLSTLAQAAADPLPGLLALRARLEGECEAFTGGAEGSPEEQDARNAFTAAEKAIETTVATSPEGLAARIEDIKLSYGSPFSEPDPRLPELVDNLPAVFLDVILEGLRSIGQ